MVTISILANTVRPSGDRRSDDTAFGVGTFSWHDPVHSWKAGPGEVMTVENLFSSPQDLYTITLASKQSVVVCVQKLKEFYNDVFPELSHESATPQTYVFYIIVHMLVI